MSSDAQPDKALPPPTETVEPTEPTEPTAAPPPDAPPERRHQASKRKILRRSIIMNAISILLALAGMAWIGRYFLRHQQFEITDDAIVDQYMAPINLRAGGYIKSLHFTEHQFVHAGDVLMIIDQTEYGLKVMEAEAALKDAQATSEALVAGVNTSRQNIAVWNANLTESRVRLRQARRDERRIATLATENAVTAQQNEKTSTDVAAMQAQREALTAHERSAYASLAETRAKIGSAEANTIRRQAELSQAQLNYSYTVVVAPYDGYVGRRTLEEGQFVQPGQLLTYIIRNDRKWITANYLESQVAGLYVGQPVRVRVDALGGRVLQGRITAISEATGSKYSLVPTDNSAGNFVKVQQRVPVRIDLLDVSAKDMATLRIGMMVEAEAKNR